MGVFWQVFSCFIICFQSILVALVFTWPSFTYKLFESNETSLDRPMTLNELSLCGSLSSIGALISTPMSGFLLDRIGRRNTTIGVSLLFVIGWALIAAFRQVEVVLAAMFVGGLGIGNFQVVPMYCEEMCQKSIAGAMASGCMVFLAIGILITYIIGGFLEYHVMVYVFLSMSVFGVLISMTLKESPVYLMKNGHEHEAVKVIAFLRNVKLNSIEVSEEIIHIKRSLYRYDGSIPEEEMSLNEEKFENVSSTDNLSTLKFLKRSKSSRRALLVATVLMITSILQGMVTVQVYAEPLFSEAVPSMSSLLCSVLFALNCLISGIVAAVLLEYFGRKIKCFGSTVALEMGWLSNFSMLYIFNPLVTLMGLGPIFYIFALVCFFNAIFSAILQPETKGLHVHEIQPKLI